MKHVVSSLIFVLAIPSSAFGRRIPRPPPAVGRLVSVSGVLDQRKDAFLLHLRNSGSTPRAVAGYIVAKKNASETGRVPFSKTVGPLGTLRAEVPLWGLIYDAAEVEVVGEYHAISSADLDSATQLMRGIATNLQEVTGAIRDTAPTERAHMISARSTGKGLVEIIDLRIIRKSDMLVEAIGEVHNRSGTAVRPEIEVILRDRNGKIVDTDTYRFRTSIPPGGRRAFKKPFLFPAAPIKSGEGSIIDLNPR